MVKTRKVIIAILLTVIPLAVSGQEQAAVTDNDVRGRLSANADWKIIKGLHLNAGYEIRVADNFSRLERHQLTAGIQYSPLKYLKTGAGYYFIGHYDSDRDFKPRHRIYADITGSYSFGRWKLSLRERFQLTHNSYEFNEFQQTPNLVELKSRLKVSYKGMIHLEPYAYAELRNCFNGPSFSADYNETKGQYTNYAFLGYHDTYINRIRGALGMEWKINRTHTIDFKIMADWCRDKKIDTNAEGTKLKSYYWEKGFNATFDIGYIISF